MKITTSDGKSLSGFEKLQDVVKKIQNTAAMQSVANAEDDGKVSYGGHSIKVDNCNSLTKKIPNVLKDMRLYNFKGEIYSGNGDVFLMNFAKRLNFLLAWLVSIAEKNSLTVGVTGEQMKDAIRWLPAIMKRVNVYSASDRNCVDKMIKKL
jgi:hypothetical protein